MEQLWAPWRMEYILQDKPDGCFLCDIPADVADRETLLLKRGHHGAIVMNRYPYNNGHLMVFPFRHVSTLGDLSPDERLEIMDLLDQAVAALTQVAAPQGFNVGINLGKVAGAGLEEHLHVHVVPRWEGDTNFMPVTTDVRVIPQALTDLWDQLYPVLNPPVAD
jgi:ATP adenylyltransferase